MSNSTHTAAIIGAGPAGLMAAETLAQGGLNVTVYDQMPSPGRKFLLAGRGGLNLTHSEGLERLLSRYGSATGRLRAAIEDFPPHALRAWCEGLGQPSFIGTSGRVFPNAMKASPLLRAWLARLARMNVSFRLRHRWTGWNKDGKLIFETPSGPASTLSDVTIFALGGATWPRLGSDGRWIEVFAERGLAVARLRPANCGFVADLSEHFLGRFEGEPLRGIELHFNCLSARAEAAVTKIGLEGGAIYALSSYLRDTIERKGEAVIFIDLRPTLSTLDLEKAFSKPKDKQSMANILRRAAKLSPVAAGLLQEAAHRAGHPLREMSSGELAALVKNVPVRLTAPSPIEHAISTAGGVSLDAIDEYFMLRTMPGTFIAGEMLDWEAPTGGYLLQACFATGAAAAKGAIRWIGCKVSR